MPKHQQPDTPLNPPGGIAALASAASITQALCLAAVEGWRLARLVPRLCAEDAPRVQSIADRLNSSLTQAGVTVEDHTHQPYVEGLAVEILTTEDRTDITPGSMQIVETVKPSVHISGQLALQGQVILGRGVAEESRRSDDASCDD